MTCRDTLQCVHEPFGDAFYFGPERLSERYEDDAKAREESGFADSTYKTIFERIERENTEVGSLPPSCGHLFLWLRHFSLSRVPTSEVARRKRKNILFSHQLLPCLNGVRS